MLASIISQFLLLSALVVLIYVFLNRKKHKSFPPGPPALPFIGSIPFIRFPVYKGFCLLSEKYGDIFSVYIGSYPVIVLNTYELVREAYSDLRFSGRPPLPFFLDRSWGKQRGIVFGDGTFWKEQRRFSIANLRNLGLKSSPELESAFVSEALKIKNAWISCTQNEPISVEHYIKLYGVNIIWRMISGKTCDASDPRLLETMGLIDKLFSDIDIQGQFTFLPWVCRLAPQLTGFSEMMTHLEQCYQFFRGIVNEHRFNETQNSQTDFINVYLRKISVTTDETSSFFKGEGEKQLLVVLLDLFAVSTDAVSHNLCWAFLFLIAYPNVQERLHKEIDEMIGNQRLPTLTDIKKMNYMQAFISEVLRRATTGTIFPRATTETLVFHGYKIPKGTTVFGNFWKIHHDKDYWGDPYEFRPERFLNEQGGFEAKERMLGFSLGTRSCPGEGVARDMMFFSLSVLLQGLTVSSDNGNFSLTPQNSVVPRPRPFKIVVNKRANYND